MSGEPYWRLNQGNIQQWPIQRTSKKIPRLHDPASGRGGEFTQLRKHLVEGLCSFFRYVAVCTERCGVCIWGMEGGKEGRADGCLAFTFDTWHIDVILSISHLNSSLTRISTFLTLPGIARRGMTFTLSINGAGSEESANKIRDGNPNFPSTVTGWFLP